MTNVSLATLEWDVLVIFLDDKDETREMLSSAYAFTYCYI